MTIYHTEITNTHIGQQVRKRRLIMGWSARTLGKKIGLSQQQISRYERGTQNFTIHRLCTFANIMKCDLNYFIEAETKADVSVTDYRSQQSIFY